MIRLGSILILLCSISLAGSLEVVTPPVSGLESGFEDIAQNLSGGRIRWSTYWRLCWTEYPGARAYELQAQTIEGVAPNLRRQSDRCFRIEVPVAKPNVCNPLRGLVGLPGHRQSRFEPVQSV